MSYVYFVSYWHSAGYGRASITSPVQINHIEQIAEMEAALMKDNGHKGLCIRSFQLLRVEE